MNDLPPKNNLSVKEVAAYLGISPQKVYQMVASGAIPSKRIDRVIKIPREAFQSWWQSVPSACEL
jgi:excisionase family DNA binding protein